MDPVGHSGVRDGIQRVRGHADAVGHSQSQGAFKDSGGLRLHRDIQEISKYANIVNSGNQEIHSEVARDVQGDQGDTTGEKG